MSDGPARLLLLRHAKSSWDDPDVADIDRPLNRRGRQDAAAVGKRLEASSLRPDLALVSSSRRTRETWELLRRAFDAPVPTRVSGDLYHAGPTALLQALREAPPEARHLLLLGHNPGIGQLAHWLGGGAGVRSAGARFLKFPTAALAIYRRLAKDWTSLDPDGVALDRFVDARTLGG